MVDLFREATQDLAGQVALLSLAVSVSWLISRCWWASGSTPPIG